MAKKIIISIITLTLFYSCNIQEDENNYLGYWITFQESNIQTLDVLVRLENSNGNLPTGARIYITTPENSIFWLTYSSELNLYKGSISSYISGNYEVNINSVLDNIEVNIDYYIIQGSPVLNSITDATGNNPLFGSDLKPDQSILLKWDLVESTTVYRGTISDEEGIVNIFNSDSNQYIIQPNTLESSKDYIIVIEAQSITGDPHFNKSNFYTYSSRESIEYHFKTQ